MPDLGAYATEVLLAYGGTLVGLIAIVALSLWRGRRVRARLDDVEARRGRKEG